MSKPKSTNVDKWKGDILPRLHFFGTTEIEELDDKEKATLSLTKIMNNAIDKANEGLFHVTANTNATCR